MSSVLIQGMEGVYSINTLANKIDRGVGITTPSAKCLDANENQIKTFISYGQGNPGATNDTLYELWAGDRVYNEVCKKVIGGKDQAGPHMTAAVIARDMISIAEAAEALLPKTSYGARPSSPLVNYWVLSQHL